MTFKETMKWLNSRSQYSWTLGELFLRVVPTGAPMETFRDSITRGSRIVERAVTIGAAVTLGVMGFMSGGILPVIGSLLAAKAAGFVAGLAADEAIMRVDNKANPPHIDAKDRVGRTKLGRAVEKKDAKTVKSLLDAGASIYVDTYSQGGYQPVSQLAARSTPEIAKLFEEAAATPRPAQTPAAPSPKAAPPSPAKP